MEKQNNEMRYLADEMGKAISTAVEQRYLEDEAELQAVLIENGWRKASEVAREIFEVIEEGIKAAVYALQFNNNPIHRNAKHEAYSSLMCFIKTIEKEYTEEGK
jgi:formaldehyde-activating enzyme involved in methanogenesis